MPAWSQAVPELLLPRDSRSLSMGGVALHRSAGASGVSVSAGMNEPGNADGTVLALDGRMLVGERLTLGAQGRGYLDRPYNVSDAAGGVTGTYRPYDLLLSFSGEYRINRSLFAGLRLTSITSDLSEKVKGSTFCGDVWAGYDASSWSVAVEGRNIGGKINYGGGEWPLPALVAVAGDWSPLSGLTVAAEADYLFAGAFMAGIGAEYGFADIAFVRAGFHYGDESRALPSFLSLGAGAKYAGIFLDAGVLLLSSTLGGSFLVTLGYSF